jgi:hypothetical protein
MSLVNVSIDTRALSKWAEELSARGFRKGGQARGCHAVG